MADTGFVTTTRGRSVTGIGSAAWSVPSNILSDNGVFSASIVPTGGRSNWLVADTFGFSVPGGDTVVGVEVKMESKVNTTSPNKMYISQAKLGKDDSTFGTDKADVTMPLDTASPWLTTFGGPTDLWGLSLTPAEVNASGFQFRFHAYNVESYSLLAQVDIIQAKVYYETPSGVIAFSRGFIIT